MAEKKNPISLCLHVLFVGLYGLLVQMKRSIFMLTRFDVESVAGSRSCVSGVSGKAFREGFTKDNRLPPQTKTPYDSTGLPQTKAA